MESNIVWVTSTSIIRRWDWKTVILIECSKTCDGECSTVGTKCGDSFVLCDRVFCSCSSIPHLLIHRSFLGPREKHSRQVALKRESIRVTLFFLSNWSFPFALSTHCFFFPFPSHSLLHYLRSFAAFHRSTEHDWISIISKWYRFIHNWIERYSRSFFFRFFFTIPDNGPRLRTVSACMQTHW